MRVGPDRWISQAISQGKLRRPRSWIPRSNALLDQNLDPFLGANPNAHLFFGLCRVFWGNLTVQGTLLAVNVRQHPPKELSLSGLITSRLCLNWPLLLGQIGYFGRYT